MSLFGLKMKTSLDLNSPNYAFNNWAPSLTEHLLSQALNFETLNISIYESRKYDFYSLDTHVFSVVC